MARVIILCFEYSHVTPIFAHYTISHSVRNGGPRPSRRRVTPESLARLGASLDQVDWSDVNNNKM